MKIGCPREIKNHEYRVGLTPAAVRAYVAAGHELFVEEGAGAGSGITDEEYVAAGATILATADEVWHEAEMIVKVKEPLAAEYSQMKEGQLVYTYFHFAAAEALLQACLERGITALAYETVKEADGSLPLLKPMSEVAGRMAPLMGAFYLSRPQGGRGTLPTGVPGVAPANILVIGGGVVGYNAARVASGLGARVMVLDVNQSRLEYLSHIMPANCFPLYSDAHSLEEGLRDADIVIGAVLIPGAKAPRLIRRDHLSLMRPGAVFVDVAIDQGGIAETSHPTTHSDPVFVVDNVIHYCVANMPGAYARTSTYSLSNYTTAYGLKLAARGVEACRGNAPLLGGLNVHRGKITCLPVAQAFGLEALYVDPEEALSL
ncbi:alanine dehydrogenase [Aminithiophilus ramosus]|uniref:Alanine dehydrogenase n=2 Tax=Synergistales TaxID=649776 RepID=A0A9Q7APF2_9BACT|nr:alanine dehydrogenase [Aminithiophilus ramosus]QTX33097.1 alanine dehydrogenase [Aminithiophilus ramosus]QVL37141.1 alanine dehydrogenase [Synergistota bacterium]